MIQKFDHRRVLTARELEVGEILHSGYLDGHCAEWKVLKVEAQKVLVIFGRTTVPIWSHEFREIPVFRATECPACQFAHKVDRQVQPFPLFHALPEPQSGPVRAVRLDQARSTGSRRENRLKRQIRAIPEAVKRREILEMVKRVLGK